MDEIEKCRNMDLAQKSRVKWEVEWDENSKFFHGMLNQRRRQQNVTGIMQDGVWVTDPVVVKEIFVDFFEDKFKPINTSIPSSPNPLFKQLSAMNQALLEASVTQEKIKEAMWSCSGDKAPGPDGITFKFIKRYWHWLKQDTFDYISEFFDTGAIPRRCNAFHHINSKDSKSIGGERLSANFVVRYSI